MRNLVLFNKFVAKLTLKISYSQLINNAFEGRIGIGEDVDRLVPISNTDKSKRKCHLYLQKAISIQHQ